MAICNECKKEYKGGKIESVFASGNFICKPCAKKIWKIQEEHGDLMQNTKLIDAAPDLLEACQRLVKNYIIREPSDLEFAKKAIRNAT